MARIKRVNAETERETLSAGRNLDEIVKEAKANAGESRATLSALTDGALTGLMNRQTKAVSAYLTKISQQIKEQEDAANAAAEQLEKIVNLVRTIDRVAVEARTLALNATIEAHRLGSQGGAFSVIATEMKKFSESVNRTSQTVGELAQDLKLALPRVSKQAHAMKVASEEFSKELSLQITEIATTSRELHESVARTQEVNDARIERVMRASQDALSHLQFQDAVAQHLLVCDSDVAAARDWTGEVLRTLGSYDSPVPSSMPSLKDVHDNQTYAAGRVTKLEGTNAFDAGEVLLF